MLDIAKRIELINALLEQDTEQSLTYAALECRLTLEYLCYERFKLYLSYLSYLSQNDLKTGSPNTSLNKFQIKLMTMFQKSSRYQYQLKK